MLLRLPLQQMLLLLLLLWSCRNYARSCSPSAPDSQSIAAATIQLEATKGRVPELPEEFVLPVASASGTCNAYLPNGPSTLPRYLWVIQYLVANGMYVTVRGCAWPGAGTCHRMIPARQYVLQFTVQAPVDDTGLDGH
jgi:hypothetical protein